MRLNRRQILAGSAAAAAAGLLPLGWRRGEEPDLAIYDSRNRTGRRFAAAARARGVATLDVAADPQAFWRRALAGFGLAAGATVVGVTGWDERVYLASALRHRGMRVRHEAKIDRRTFEWRIA